MTDAVKERPILFSGKMVRETLEGRKTQTRRVNKCHQAGVEGQSPYGCVGDRLWVRETFRIRAQGIEYKADLDECSYGWKPSIHMPRCASRITLEITGFRVERLQGISEDDAKAEGFESVMEFAQFWDSIAKPGTKWSDNPWVRVIEFRRVENAQGE